MSARPVMTPEEAVAVCERALSFATADQTTVAVTHASQGVTRVANGQVLAGDDGELLTVQIFVRIGKRNGITETINQRDDASLRAAVAHAEELARGESGPEEDLEYIPIPPQQYTPVSLWHDTTAEALEGARHEIIPQLIKTVRASGLDGAGFVGGVARTRAIVRKSGLVAVCQDTDLECTVTAASADGKGSGWAGAAARDWTKLNPVAVAERAVEIGKRAQNPVAFEPGRRTAILGPTAVAQLVRAMGYAYASPEVYNGQSPFSNPPDGDKIGERMFDARLNFTSDPADPDGGYAPFYEMSTGDAAGIPMGRIAWVEKGVLKSLSYGIGESIRRGRQHHITPHSMHLSAVPGTPLMTLEEMIASCELGIYVNRFHEIQGIPEQRQSGVVTGSTRDGCFLVQDGKIDRPLNNFRIQESPFFAFNRVMAIGRSERASLGFVRPDEFAQFQDAWPLPPVIVPPLMVQDFNFNSLSAAI